MKFPEKSMHKERADFFQSRAASFEVALLEVVGTLGLTTEESNEFLAQSDWADRVPQLVRERMGARWQAAKMLGQAVSFAACGEVPDSLLLRQWREAYNAVLRQAGKT